MAIHSISLCAGVAGIDLGLRIAEPDIRTVCYVEWAKFPAAVIAARIADEALHDAPIWDDVTSFDGRPWRGKVDLITAGFPCQPVSLAGKRLGMSDERFIWGDVARIIGEIRPGRVLLENVPGILTADGGAFLGRVLGDLAELGFDAEWDLFSAEETGAPHLRKRWFLLAYSDEYRQRTRQRGIQRDVEDRVTELAYAGLQPINQIGRGIRGQHPASSGELGIANGRQQQPGYEADPIGQGGGVYPPARNDYAGWSAIDASAQPAIRRDADGLAAGLDQSLFAYRNDRLKAVGNGVVPLTVALAWIELNRRIA